jgi:hypothetical protein
VDLYEGVSFGFGGSASQTTSSPGATVRSLTGNASGSVKPHPSLVLTGAYGYLRTLGGGGGEGVLWSTRWDAQAAWTPSPALALNAGVGRVDGSTQREPQNLWSWTASFSPLAGGDLSLRFNWFETLDASTSTRTRVYGPSLRWRIRRGTFLDWNATVDETRSPAGKARQESLSVALYVPLW